MRGVRTVTLYKVLGPQAEPVHGGNGAWHLPRGKRPGKWMPEVASPKCCARGYHLVELQALLEWLRADCTIWEAEGRGASHTDGSGKTSYAQARLLRRVQLSERDMRLFAADCAEHVLCLFESRCPNDDRPRRAIDAARAYARGEIDEAARAAAGAAARTAAWAAAWAAAGAAESAAAWTAARAAARAAAGAAESAAARADERAWQGQRLATYLTGGQP